jgi:predicted aldo/keto reductase-like oxidoreductase
MQRIVLGRTGLEVYRLGFGGIPIQRVSEAQAVETVRHAVEAGLDFIDTSRAYTTSERRIGLALKEAGAVVGPQPPGGSGRRVVVASKSPAKTADAMRADLETSLQELDLDYLDIYKCHFVATPADYQKVTAPGGALEALQKAREEGLIGHLGITSHNLSVLERALDDDLFDVIMVCFSFLEPQARETVIPQARRRNVGVLAMKPFSGGAIEEARLALKYALSEPGVLVLAGVEHPELFDENWRVFQETTPLTQSERLRIAEIRATYDKVFCRRCDYCQPCPEGIPIQTVLGLRQMVKRMGKDLLQASPFWAAIQKGHDCTACGECTTRCPYELAIPDLIRANLKWLEEE